MIRIVVVDDSSAVRTMVCSVLDREPDLEIVGTAKNGEEALGVIKSVNPDIVTMDVEMPVMDGIQAVTELRRRGSKVPVIVFSTLTKRGAEAALEAMARGADDFVTKPNQSRNIRDSIAVLRRELCRKIRNHVGIRRNREQKRKLALIPKPAPSAAVKEPAAPVERIATRVAKLSPRPEPARSRPPLPSRERPPAADAPKRTSNHRLPTEPRTDLPMPSSRRTEIVVVGCSTGGPDALTAFLCSLPKDFPVPVVVVQHMPETFTAMLAERLDGKCPLKVDEAKDGDIVEPGRVLIARGGRHLGVRRRASHIEVYQSDEAPENSCRPAVDYLFRSASQVFGDRTLAVVMTGMGSDGALGAEDVRRSGGAVVVQDEETSVVWGMPGAVAERGMANEVLALSRLGPRVVELVRGRIVAGTSS